MSKSKVFVLLMDDTWPHAHQLLFMFPGAMGNMLLTINYKTESDCVEVARIQNFAQPSNAFSEFNSGNGTITIIAVETVPREQVT